MIHLALAPRPSRTYNQRIGAGHRVTASQLRETNVITGHHTELPAIDIHQRRNLMPRSDRIGFTLAERVVEMDLAVFEKNPAMVDDEETVVWQVDSVFVKMDRTHDGDIVGFADTAQRGDERAVYGLRVVGRVVWVVVTPGDQTFRQQQYPCMVACCFAGEPADDVDVVLRLFRYGELPDRHFHVSHCHIIARVEVGQVKGHFRDSAVARMFRIRAFVSALLRFG